MYIDRDRSTKIFCEFFPPPRKSRSAGGGFFQSTGPDPDPDPAAARRRLVSFPRETPRRAPPRRGVESVNRRLGCRSVGRTVRTRETRARGRRVVSLSLCVCVSLWLSDPLSLSLVALDPAPTKKRALATESNQINQSARRRRRRRGRVEESSRRREARGRVPDDRGARRGRRRRRIETKDTAV